MKRRQFLKLSGIMGISGLLAGLPKSMLYAAHDNYQGPLWMMVNADGGWDPTSFCDPKGYNGTNDQRNPNRINDYDRNEIGSVGNLMFAPSPNIFRLSQYAYDPNLYSVKTFYEKYYQDILVINGINCGTNSHADGQLNNWSGRLIANTPSFAALVAATLAPEKPLAFITNGGYSYTDGLVSPTRMSLDQLLALFELSFPNRSSDARSFNSRQYYASDIVELIQTESHLRLQRLQAEQNLPRIQSAMQNLLKSRQGLEHLKAFVNNLESFPELPLSFFKGRKKAYTMYQQGRLALAGYAAGVTASVSLSLSGFDTHARHDFEHYQLLMDLFSAIDAIMITAEEVNLRDKLVMGVASDFGRTNHYNGDDGKDHWPITSMLLMGNSVQRIQGNRIIGATTDTQHAVKLDPITLNPDLNNDNPNAVELTPAHIHRALRRLAGIENSPATIQYPLTGTDLPLFG